MLSNPKTHVRNMIGNFVMQAAYVPRNIISGALQDIKGGEQTHSVVNTFKNTTGNSNKELKDFAKRDYSDNAERVLRNIGNRYDDVSGEFASKQNVFGDTVAGRVLEQLAGSGKYSVGSVLDAEDMMFKKLTYKNALTDYMKANGISVQDAVNNVTKPNGASIAKGREYAKSEAEKATFTEENIAAKWLSQGENKLGLPGTVIIGSIMPFKKTPMNILSRGVEFSPVGVGMMAYKWYHAAKGIKTKSNKYYTMNDVMDSIGANVTGSGILALGMYMASQGLLVTTGDDDDQRKARYDSQMGDQNFAVVNPDTGESWTIDWLAPSVMPLLTGVEVYRQLFKDNEDVDGNVLNRALESASKIADPVFEMSCMQGVASALASYSGDAGDIASSLMSNVATGIAGQFIPQPMAALARTIDDTIRSSYAPKDSDVLGGKVVESFLRQQRSKIPGMSQQNQPSIDVWGNERKRELAGSEMDQVIMRTLNSFLNPSNYSSNKRTALDEQLDELYRATGNSNVLPKSAAGYIDESQQNPRIYLTSEEYTQFARTKGQKSQQYVSDFVNSELYNSLDADTKAEIVADLYNLANYEARKEAITGRGTPYSTDQYEKVLESGVSPYQYYATKSRFGGKWSNYDVAEKYAGYADRMQMTEDKFVEVYDALGDLKADKKANGKTISGSRQKKVKNYLNTALKNGEITKEQWWYFYTDEYPSEAVNSPYDWIKEANK